ncbi:(Na+)-NQR maturation NqrM [Alcanivorax sp. JB21]|uniref:(Na+)-NQR maturation NqrM n=1 Tax=Alcanivorax limicola TaxID=2874102 RepID=UPI001CBB5A6C|nr:(Na+)-NQR maturation NqrM [Alcanivorax limicola]MBZ2188030.1 (Na+)-NQR maturation NqrM [Alcanivorax limicola]
MLTTFLAAIVVVGILFAGMAIGVIVSNKPVKGSCGGLSAVGLQGSCDICGRDPVDCDNPDVRDEVTRARAANLSTNALGDVDTGRE